MYRDSLHSLHLITLAKMSSLKRRFTGALVKNVECFMKITWRIASRITDCFGQPCVLWLRAVLSWSYCHDRADAFEMWSLAPCILNFYEGKELRSRLRKARDQGMGIREHCTVSCRQFLDAGHGGKSGRDSAIEEIAFDYSFILKITNHIYKFILTICFLNL